MKATNASFGRDAEAVGVHLAQLGQALVPQLGVPGVVVAVGAEAHLDVELGHGGDPAAERLEQAHLDPLVVTDAAGRLLHVEEAGKLAAVPWCECAHAAAGLSRACGEIQAVGAADSPGPAARAVRGPSSATRIPRQDEEGAGDAQRAQAVTDEVARRRRRTPARA